MKLNDYFVATLITALWLSGIDLPVKAVLAEHSPVENVLDDKLAAEAVAEFPLVPVVASLSSMLSPGSASWSSVPQTALPLFSQSIVAPQGGGSIKDIFVRAARVEGGVVFLVEWIDETRDDGRNGSRFNDGMAIEFPVDSSGDTRLSMGHSGGPVNILHWTAMPKGKRHGTRQAEELVAAGIHNRAPKPESLQNLQSVSVWKNHKWSVVIFKPDHGADTSSPKFESGTRTPIAFAVWNGGAGERLGLKSVSNWTALNCK